MHPVSSAGPWFKNIHVKKLLCGIPVLLLAALVSLQADAFIPGNIVVSRVGDGTNALANTGGPISLLEFDSVGALQQTIEISTTITAGLQWSGTATSEGAITLSSDGTELTLVGYVPPFTGAGSLPSRTDTDAPRGYVTVGADGVASSPVLVHAYSGNNIRSGVSDGDNVYMAGGNSGTLMWDGSSNTTIQSTVANTRIVNIFDDNLYFTTSSGANRGVYSFSGLPTSTSAPTLFIDTGATSGPYDFSISPTGTLAYIADDRAFASGGGIQRWSFNGSVWTLDYTLSTGLASGLTGLGVDFSGLDPVIYAVNPGTFYQITDTGVGSSATVLASAGTNYAFRGVELAPVPEPATIVLVTAGLCLVLWRTRRRTA
jgi:hypothetical protein